MIKKWLIVGCTATVVLSVIMVGGWFLKSRPAISVIRDDAHVPAEAGEKFTRWIENLAEDEVLVLGNESMPFCGLEGGQDVGMAVDLLNAITTAGGPRFQFKLGLPWKRAQVMVHQKKGARVAIIPLTRTPTREDHYVWIVNLIPHRLHLHTFGSPAALNSVDEAKTREVGIIRGSALIPLLKQLGFTRIRETRNAEAGARMLVEGRVEVMAESQWVNTYVWQKIGQDPGELQIGPAIGETHHIYLGADPSFPAEVSEKIRNAMQEIRTSGKLDAIYEKWQR